MSQNRNTNVELFFKAAGLRDADWSGTSDPMLVVSLQNLTVNRFEKVGRTEVKPETTDPTWDTSVTLPYAFAEEQTLELVVYDVDDDGADVSHHDNLGSTRVELGVLLQNGTTTFNLSKGTLTVTAEKKEDAHEVCSFDISCTDLHKMDWASQSDGFLKIWRETGDVKTEWVLVHTTEVVPKNKNPHWKPFTLTSSELCNSDHLRTLRFECYDSDGPGDEELIGSFTCCLKDLTSGNVHYTLESPKGKDYGKIHFESCKVVQVPTFTDYLQAGMRLAVDYAVDFTGSNGDPSDPSSLHYCMAGTTQYEDAIDASGRVVLPYDSDGTATMYGFGGVFDGARTSHCFDLGEGKGVEGLHQIYRQTLKTVQLSGKTYFREILETAMANAASRKNTYSVLVILSDGAIHDKPQVKAMLRKCSDLAISVVVVGIGNADFSSMEDLDDLDDGEVGRYRDVLQFVKWNKYRNNPRLFAAETLREIPSQVEEYNKRARRVPADYSS